MQTEPLDHGALLRELADAGFTLEEAQHIFDAALRFNATVEVG